LRLTDELFTGHKYLRPKSIHDHEVVEEVSKDYMYFACIRFINSVREMATGSVRMQFTCIPRLKRRRCGGIPQCWTTFQLYACSIVSQVANLNIESPLAQVKTWDKVNQGMIKMYHAEVLGKLPVVQHFLFGSILSYEGPVGLGPLPASEEYHHHHHGHTHGTATADAPDMHAGWHDPCGIPMPSAFAAAAEAQKMQAGASLGGPGIRPVPFD
jgi:serine/threonine-protein phosphatase 2A activator